MMAKPQEYLREIAPRIDSIYQGALTDAAERLEALESVANDLLRQIDIGDFVDSNGHSAKMLKPVWDLMQLMTPPVAQIQQVFGGRVDPSYVSGTMTEAAGAAPVPQMTGAALASQEPVAEVLLVDGEKVIDASMAFFDSVELGTKLYLAAGAAPGKVVVTKNEAGQIVAVTRQNDEGQIIEVIAESAGAAEIKS